MSISRLIHGDCLVELPKLIKKGIRVDMVLSDIPYGNMKGEKSASKFMRESADFDTKIDTKKWVENIEK